MSLPFARTQVPVEGATLVSRQGLRARRRAMHNGIDLSVIGSHGRALHGAAIRPIAPGVVEQVCLFPGACCGGYGNTVLVKHSDDLLSFYAHMDRVDVVAGQEVAYDSVLGTVGDTFADWHVAECPRLSMVPHLHLEVRHADGSRYDVLQVLAAGGLAVAADATLAVAEPFEYAEPGLAGVDITKGYRYPEEIMGPALRYGRWYTLGLPVAVAGGVAGATVLGIWLATRRRGA